MRNRFDEQLFELNREIIEMGAMCERAVAQVTEAMGNGDLKLISRVSIRGNYIWLFLFNINKKVVKYMELPGLM